MDGDIAPLAEITSVAVEYGAMVMVDEAHATGVFGPGGSGLIREYGLEDRVNVSMGTLSKALGGYGGFIACSPPLRELLVNRAEIVYLHYRTSARRRGKRSWRSGRVEKAGNPGAELLRQGCNFQEAAAGGRP